ncbi:MAG: RNA 2',3'-cyclic phosphodiesterase [Actinomycetota bacterium]|nr:RNA 2',3'-cyclic phosphodiesterase [Actinomycetota bacterium]
MERTARPLVEPMRTFVAVFPPLEVRRALIGAARELPVVGEVRWIRPENVHLTLRFLGDVSKDELGRVAEALEPVCLRHGPFKAEPSSFGAFPSARRARILWAGIGEGSDRLRALVKDVEASLEPLGFGREDRAYTPHLTLARARGRPVVVQDTETPSTVPSFAVRHTELVQSVLGGAGATYSTLATYRLSEDRD